MWSMPCHASTCVQRVAAQHSLASMHTSLGRFGQGNALSTMPSKSCPYSSRSVQRHRGCPSACPRWARHQRRRRAATGACPSPSRGDGSCTGRQQHRSRRQLRTGVQGRGRPCGVCGVAAGDDGGFPLWRRSIHRGGNAHHVGPDGAPRDTLARPAGRQAGARRGAHGGTAAAAGVPSGAAAHPARLGRPAQQHRHGGGAPEDDCGAVGGDAGGAAGWLVAAQYGQRLA